jgi:3-oxoacyl-ACP reductase-like protein
MGRAKKKFVTMSLLDKNLEAVEVLILTVGLRVWGFSRARAEIEMGKFFCLDGCWVMIGNLLELARKIMKKC